MVQNIETLDVSLIATGCSNLCRHCYASATHKIPLPMDLDKVKEIMKLLSPLITRAAKTMVDVYYDTFDHPQAPEVLEFLWQHDWYDYFEVIPTNGRGLVKYERFRKFLHRMREMGTKYMQLSVHGGEEEHDWFVRRRGAFRDLLIAAQAGVEARMRIDWVAWANKRNVRELAILRDQVISIEKCVFGIAVPSCSGYAMEIEELRVDVADREYLKSDFGEKILDFCRTEGEWRQSAIVGEMEKKREPSITMGIDIDGQCNVSRQGTLLGNLGSETIEIILNRYEERFLKDQGSESIAKLAMEFGNTQSTKLYRQPQVIEVWRNRKAGHRF